MTKQPPKILVVDDEPDLCEILKFNLEASGNVVMTAHSAEEALFVIAQHGYPDLLLLDVRQFLYLRGCSCEDEVSAHPMPVSSQPSS